MGVILMLGSRGGGREIAQSLVVGWRIVGQSQAAGSTRGGLCEREIQDMNW